ncbi:MAG TPA: hypothetical protein VIK93_09110 [Limnochordales bacterium]
MTGARAPRTKACRLAAVWGACWLVALAAWPAQGQVPLDPFGWHAAPAGSLEYELVVDVVPSGSAAPVGAGELVLRHRYDVSASAALRYMVSDRLSLRAAAAVHGWAARAGPHGHPPPPWQWSADAPQGTVGAGWRFLPHSPLDPRLDVDLHTGAVPWLEAHMSVSRVRDPVVLNGALGVRWLPATGGGGLGISAAARASFVANERVSFVAGIAHVFPAGMLDLPATALSAGVYYAWDGTNGAGLGLEALVLVRGGAVDAGFRVTWMGRRMP